MSFIVNLLKRDHQQLKKSIKTLKDDKASIEDMKTAFKKLVVDLHSHTHAEEDVVYTFMKKDSELSHYASEGIEEHTLVDLVVTKMQRAQSDERWKARSKVLSELISHHLEEEEEEIFPKLVEKLDEELDRKLGEMYSQKVNQKTNISEQVETHKKTGREFATQFVH